MNVLVVDDSDQVRDLLRRYLHPHGMHVREAIDRESAIGEVHNGPVDIVLIDWVLRPWSAAESDDNGVGVCRALRSGGCKAQIVMYSAVARTGESLIDALDAGADEFIESPLTNLQTLSARVRALRRRVGWSEGPLATPDKSTRRDTDVVVDWQQRYGLTSAEAIVLRLGVRGRSRAEIAAEIRVAPSTLKTHVHHLVQKTGDASLSTAIQRLMREASDAPVESPP